VTAEHLGRCWARRRNSAAIAAAHRPLTPASIFIEEQGDVVDRPPQAGGERPAGSGLSSRQRRHLLAAGRGCAGRLAENRTWTRSAAVILLVATGLQRHAEAHIEQEAKLV